MQPMVVEVVRRLEVYSRRSDGIFVDADFVWGKSDRNRHVECGCVGRWSSTVD
jgi:hypothetical protein